MIYEIRGEKYNLVGYKAEIRHILRVSINRAIFEEKQKGGSTLLDKEILDLQGTFYDRWITDPLHTLLATYLTMYAEVSDEPAMKLYLGKPPESKYATLALDPDNTVYLTTYNTGRARDGITERWPQINEKI